MRRSIFAPLLCVLSSLALLAALSACEKQEPRAAQSADTSHSSALDPTAVIRAAADSILAAFGRQDSASYFSRFAPEASFIFHTTLRRLCGRLASVSGAVRSAVSGVMPAVFNSSLKLVERRSPKTSWPCRTSSAPRGNPT